MAGEGGTQQLSQRRRPRLSGLHLASPRKELLQTSMVQLFVAIRTNESLRRDHLQTSKPALFPTEILTMIFIELQNELLAEAVLDHGFASSIKFFSWTAVLYVCANWRYAALGYSLLWTTMTLTPGKLFGHAMVEDKDDPKGMKPVWPTATSPMTLFAESTDSNEPLLEVLPVSRIQQAYLTITSNRNREGLHGLMRTIAPTLRTLAVADRGDCPKKITGDFASLVALTIRGYASFEPLRFSRLRTLNIAEATFRRPRHLDKFATRLQAVIDLNDVCFQDVEFPETNDTTNNNRLRGSTLRRITCTRTTNVAAFLQCFGIRDKVVLVMENITVGDILPADADVRGPFIGIENADLYIKNGKLQVVISQNSSELRAEWKLNSWDWQRTFYGILKCIHTLRLHDTEGVDNGWSKGRDIRGRIMHLARKADVQVL